MSGIVTVTFHTDRASDTEVSELLDGVRRSLPAAFSQATIAELTLVSFAPDPMITRSELDGIVAAAVAAALKTERERVAGA